MSSGTRKRKQIKQTRAERKADLEKTELVIGLKKGTIIAVNKEKVFSRTVLPKIPDYYRDAWFTCKDCGQRDLWTARQQQRWYEEQGGEIEAIAIRCRACRRREKARREKARKIHMEGLARKRSGQS
jgi:hypothetical protein